MEKKSWIEIIISVVISTLASVLLVYTFYDIQRENFQGELDENKREISHSFEKVASDFSKLASSIAQLNDLVMEYKHSVVQHSTATSSVPNPASNLPEQEKKLLDTHHESLTQEKSPVLSSPASSDVDDRNVANTHSGVNAGTGEVLKDVKPANDANMEPKVSINDSMLPLEH